MAQVAANAAAHRARRVTGIRLRIGPLAGVEAELLQRAFLIARAGTLAETATLTIEAAPVTVACRVCGGGGAAAANRLLCPDCGAWQVTLTGGDDLILASLDLADIDSIERETI